MDRNGTRKEGMPLLTPRAPGASPSGHPRMGEAVAEAVRRVMTAATIVLVENCILTVKLALTLGMYECVGLEVWDVERVMRSDVSKICSGR